jgi:hypothetical protein
MALGSSNASIPAVPKANCQARQETDDWPRRGLELGSTDWQIPAVRSRQ